MGLHFPDPAQIVQKIEHGVQDGLHQVEHAQQQAQHTITGACDRALHQVEGAAQSGVHQVEHAGQQALHDIEQATQQTAEALLAAVAGQALHKALDIARALAPDTFSLQIGPVILEVDAIADRLEHLERWVQHPPKQPADIKQLILDLTPTACGIQVSAEFALLFVSSSSLSVGVAATWQTESFLRQFDQILKDL